MTHRLHALDSLRASMMFLGIFLHVACAYCNLPDVWWYRDPQRSLFFDLALVIIHIFRMPVFMVMAGFFSALLVEKRGVSGFLRNRAARIGLPLLLGVLTLYPLLWMMARYGRTLQQPDALQAAWQAFLRLGWLSHIDTTHLWFLNYLLYLYALAVAVRWMARPIAPKVTALVGRMLGHPVRLLILPAMTLATLAVMPIGILDTQNDWIPDARILAAYSIFFGFGWLLYSHLDQLPKWQETAWSHLGWAIPVAGLHALGAYLQILAAPNFNRPAFWLTAVTASLAVWLLIFGLTGLFLRYFSRENARWRYLSDSAYWIYIVHSPVVLLLQIVFGPLALNAFVKAAVVTLLSAVVLLISYDLFARSTWIGVLLNGRRYRRALGPRRAEPQLAREAAQ